MSNSSVKSDLTQFKQPEKRSEIKTGGQYYFRFNFDGIVVYSPDPESPEYTLIFHNGAIEAVWTQRLLAPKLARLFLAHYFKER